MTDVRIVHELDCSEETFWNQCFFDEEFNRKLFLEALAFPVWRILEQNKQGDTVTRSIETQPRLENMPGPMKKLVGEKLSYIESGTYSAKTKRYEFKIVPSTLAEKTNIRGVMYCDPISDKKIRRIVEIKFEVKVFAIGKMIEEKTAQDTRTSYDKAAAFTNQWVREKGY